MIVNCYIDSAVHDITTAATEEQWKGVTDREETYCVWRARQSAAALAFTSHKMLALGREVLCSSLTGDDCDLYFEGMLDEGLTKSRYKTLEAMQGYLSCVEALVSGKSQVSGRCGCNFTDEEMENVIDGYQHGFAYVDLTHKKHGVVLGNHKNKTEQEYLTEKRTRLSILSKATTEWRLRMWHGIMIIRDDEQDN